jgi:ankyrin repeat protein
MFRILLVLLVSLHISLPVLAGARDDMRLITGARHGNLGMIQAALGAGASVQATDEIGRTALMWAAFRGEKDTVSYLIDNGSDVNAGDSRDRTALMWAAVAGNGEVIGVLLHHGADIGLVDANGTDAIGHAKAENHQHVVDQLAEALEGSGQ